MKIIAATIRNNLPIIHLNSFSSLVHYFEVNMTQDVLVTSIKRVFGSTSKCIKINQCNKIKLSENDIDYEELLKFESEQLLCQILVEECQISKLAGSRIITVLKTIPESEICKQKHNVKIVTISNDEQDALDNIQNASKKVQNIINRITVNMSHFDNIIKILNKRRGQLLSNLKRITQKKENKLLSEQNTLNSHKKASNDFYKKCQLIIHNLDMNKSQRRNKILTNTNKLLQNKIIDNDTIHMNVPMNFKMDINKINNILLNIGEIEYDNIPLSPVVYIKNIKDTSSMIAIASDIQSLKSKGIEYKYKYCEYNDDIKSNDDMKLE